MLAILPAPSILGLKPTGAQDSPTALLDNGLAQRLGARVESPVSVPAYAEQRDPADGIRNKTQIAAFTQTLADRVEALLADEAFPIVLGGDCSILLGNLLAMRRRGRPGLLFLDGHADFYQPEANINGEAASSELAFATGRGPEQVTRFEGYQRLVRDDDVVAMGQRDAEEAAKYGSQDLPGGVRQYDLDAIRAMDAEQATREAVEHLESPPRDGFWIHLDVDVLDDAIMPAVDYRMPGGLNWHELGPILRTSLASPQGMGLDVTIYNPRLDGSGAGEALVDHLCRSLEGLEAPLRRAS